jgi:uncharacterized repeat protein (TIGR01451 family)
MEPSRAGPGNVKKIPIVVALLAVLLLAGMIGAYAQTGGDWTLGRWTVSGGSGTSSGGSYTLRGTAGQAGAGTVSGGTFTLRGGFWGPAVPAGEQCDPVTGVHLSRAPEGDLFAGDLVRLAVTAGGTIPFTYTWRLDGELVGDNRSTYEHTFDSAGTYIVSVVVDNDCGQGSDSLAVEVLSPGPGQPDLSRSDKSATLTSVEAGDLLTYTLYLRNSRPGSAAAVLDDPIPAYTTYLTGSARASDGAPLTLVDGQLHWSGQIISGTPVLVAFAVEVQAAPVGTAITNAARLDDGQGGVVVLEAASTYNPGYRLTIDDGALYTNLPTVTLRYSWNAADNIVQVKFSNDGGFVPGSNTTAWLPVDPQDATYPDWLLATYGSLMLPRTVYAKFRDASGRQYGPVQDEIIYDPDAPLVVGVEILPQGVRGSGAAQGQNVIVRVTASDANSGVGTVQISHRADFGTYAGFPSAGPITYVPWALQPSGLVYVRVVDRAGNLSPVSSEQGPTRFEAYLPMLLRGGTIP